MVGEDFGDHMGTGCPGHPSPPGWDRTGACWRDDCTGDPRCRSQAAPTQPSNRRSYPEQHVLPWSTVPEGTGRVPRRWSQERRGFGVMWCVITRASFPGSRPGSVRSCMASSRLDTQEKPAQKREMKRQNVLDTGGNACYHLGKHIGVGPTEEPEAASRLWSCEKSMTLGASSAAIGAGWV